MLKYEVGALHTAARFNYFDEVVLLLEAGSRVGDRTLQGNTPLHLAAHEGNTGIAVLLVDCGADPNSLNQAGETALHRAMNSGSEDCITAMICAGANTKTRDMYGRALVNHLAELPVAAFRGITHVVDIHHARDQFGSGLLHLAVRADNYALACSLCVTAAVNLNCTNAVGDTPLHEAVHRAYPNMAEILLRCGASLYIKNVQGVSALDLSSRSLGGGLAAETGDQQCREVRARHASVQTLLAVHDMDLRHLRGRIGAWFTV
jgi:ankyrin repeat protein